MESRLPAVIKPSWCLITTYKNNFEVMEAYVNFYAQFWGIRKFYFLIGNTGRSLDGPLQRIETLNKSSNVLIETEVFDTDEFIKPSMWSQQKLGFLTKLDKRIPSDVTHVLNVDNDEFLYVHDMDQVDHQEALHFHFVEMLPQNHFSIENDLLWSLQGWFYRINFFRNADPTQLSLNIKPKEIELLDKDVPRSLSPLPPLQLTHKWCKRIFFRRENILSSWVHLDGGPICEQMRQLEDPSAILALLRSSYFCYHMGVLDPAYFAQAKPKWINPYTGHVKTQAGDFSTSVFDEYYSQTESFTFTDNFLKAYWKQP